MESDFNLDDKVFIVTDDNIILSGLVYGKEDELIQVKLENGFISWFDKIELTKFYDQAELIAEEKFKSNTQEWNP